MNDGLKLKGRMNTWGPFGEREGETLVFSMGNDDEEHGYALPRDNDSRCAMHVATRTCERTGARYVGHVPFTTDRVGKIAKDWSPGYLPMEECARKSAAFVHRHCSLLQERGLKFSRVFIIVGHGGNKGIERYACWEETAALLGIEAPHLLPAITVNIGRLLAELEPFSEETRQAYLGVRGGHADTMEHSIAAVCGGLDYGKLHVMNTVMKQHGTDEALRRWPVIGGLGGYLKFGGERYDPLRGVAGLKECLAKFETDGQIHVFPEFARIVVGQSIDAASRLVHPLEG